MTSGPTASESLAARAGSLFSAYVDGDEQRLGEMVDLLTPLLWHTARSQGAGTATAEDAVQTAWLRLVDYAPSIRDHRAVLAWLVQTTRRETWRLVRVERRVGAIEDVTEQPAATLDPETQAILGDMQRMLWGHITKLPARCQQLLRVIAFADRPDYASLAEAMGMPIGSIGPTRGRCLSKLRLSLAADPKWVNP